MSDIGEYPNGEDTVSKTATPQGAEGSTPSLSVEYDGIEKRKKTRSVFDKPPTSVFDKPKTEPLFRLNLYRADGTMRTEVSKAMYIELARRYGDLMRCVSSARWSSMDEICTQVWELEKRSHLKSFTRTRKEIEVGVLDMVELGAVLTK